MRKFFRELIVICTFALVLATLATFAVFKIRRHMSETFLSDLVNLNAILVAAMAFLIPNFLQTSKLNEFAEKLWKSVIDPNTDPINKSYQRKFLAKALYILLVTPLIGIIPFFFSAIVALVATLGYQRVLLGEVAFWVMLFFFLLITMVYWKLAHSVSRAVK